MKSFFDAWCEGDPRAHALLPCAPTERESWLDAAARAALRPAGPALLLELERQNLALPASAARGASLAALRQGAPVIVTGQQVGFLTGPLYTLHKAATVIARARWVSRETGRPCVPLFWVQNEDHDWAEIAPAHVLTPSGPVTVSLPAETEAHARVSMASRLLPVETDALVASLEPHLAGLPAGPEVLGLLARHYRAGVRPADAFVGVMAELFEAEGLLFLDPRTEAVARLAAPIIARSLIEHDAIAARLSASAAALTAAGFAEQVPVRADATLAFFHPDGPDGPRHRLVFRAGGFHLPGTGHHGPRALTLRQLMERLEVAPLSFSTSALLRPLVQDTLLPTLAYVGGPAECTYFAQLPGVYEVFALPLPLIAPRARFRLVDDAVRSLLRRLHVTANVVDQPRTALLAQVVGRPPRLEPPEAMVASVAGPTLARLDELAGLVATFDASLEGPVARTKDMVRDAVARLVAKVDRGALERDRVVSERVDRLYAALKPGGAPQERVYGFAGVAARVGTRALVERLVDAASSLDPKVRTVDV